LDAAADFMTGIKLEFAAGETKLISDGCKKRDQLWRFLRMMVM